MDNNTFNTKPIEDIFNHATLNNISKKALSWYTRDGRRPNNSLLNEEEYLFKEHLEFISKKASNIQTLDSTEFVVAFFNVKENSKQELNIPKQPLIKFSNLNGMPPQLGENIKNLQFNYMTPIQKVVIPYMQNKKDVVAVSETGSGKTIAYLFPLIGNMLVKGTPINPYINSNLNNNTFNFNAKIAYPLSLVLVPTRELAEQVYKESKKICYKTGINTVKVYGGVPPDSQIQALNEGCDILIATPGRLLDHMRKGRISLKMISTLIIDEADRMLDMGFSEQLKQIVQSDMPDKNNRQNLMFSATFSDEIKEIARNFLKDFYFVQPKQQAPKQIIQEIVNAPESQKPKILCDILKTIKGSVLIFIDMKRKVDELAYNLNNEGFKVVSIHGNRNQFQRQYAIQSFSNGNVPILIATDVASRGLDFPNVSCVINYEMPTNIEDYIHRIGRTGRIGQVGKAISFINNSNSMIFKKLYNLLKSQKQNIPDWFEEMYKSCLDLGNKNSMNWNANKYGVNKSYHSSYNNYTNYMSNNLHSAWNYNYTTLNKGGDNTIANKNVSSHSSWMNHDLHKINYSISDTKGNNEKYSQNKYGNGYKHEDFININEEAGRKRNRSRSRSRERNDYGGWA